MSHSADGGLQLLQGVRIGDSKIPLATVTKCGSGHGSYFFLLQESGGELFTGHAEFLDAGEYIECTVRLKAFQSHLTERIHQKASSLIIGRAHLLDVGISVFNASTAAYWLVVGAHIMAN